MWGDGMMAARDEARARIAARLARDTRREPPVAQEAAGAVTGASETFVERAVRRLEVRRVACEVACWHPTPRPGEGRAPTTAG
jgi:hypothetical protein